MFRANVLCQALCVITRIGSASEGSAPHARSCTKRLSCSERKSTTCARNLSNVARSVEMFTSPQFTSFVVDSSSTMNLSFGERPVRSPVSVTRAPCALRTPSFLAIEMSSSTSVSRFQWTSPLGLNPCAVKGVDVGVEVSAMFFPPAVCLCPFLFAHTKIGQELISKGEV